MKFEFTWKYASRKMKVIIKAKNKESAIDKLLKRYIEVYQSGKSFKCKEIK